MEGRKAFWNFTLACVLIAIVNAVSLILVGPYAPSGMAAGASLAPLTLIPGMMETYPGLHLLRLFFYIAAAWGVGTIVGSFIAAVCSGNFGIRRPARGQTIRSFIGGLLMGIALLMVGGGIAHLAMLPLLLPTSMLAFCGISIGAYLGARLMLWRFSRQEGG